MRLCSSMPAKLSLSLIITGFLASAAIALQYPELVKSVDPARAKRYEVFKDFQIHGVCGTTRLDLAVGQGANTIRTYTPPSRKQLDAYQRLGLKVIVGIWMPHQGKNQGNGGLKWDYDYHEKSDEQLKSFLDTLAKIGDHPAILLWCFGNEVHVDAPYLETVNRLSLALHEKYPTQLSSLTIVNAPAERIALIKQHAPDIDVIGYNSYGHGAVGSASERLEKEWGRAYYVSEFGPQGPWWGRKTAWGVNYEQSYDTKLSDLRQSFVKIDAAPRCLGSTMFLWGAWNKQLPTYFSAFLSPDGAKKAADEALYITPMADEFAKYWSGKYPSERAPILQSIDIQSPDSEKDIVLTAGQTFRASAKADDPDTPAAKLTYRWWILDEKGKAVRPPIDTQEPRIELQAPLPGKQTVKEQGYYLMTFVIAPDQRASGYTVPFLVKLPGAKDPS